MIIRKRGLAAEHGEFITYNRGCRCSACRAANATYNRDHRAQRGKTYTRNNNLRHAHGITLLEYTELLAAQQGV